jgi:hypothetical protein
VGQAAEGMAAPVAGATGVVAAMRQQLIARSLKGAKVTAINIVPQTMVLPTPQAKAAKAPPANFSTYVFAAVITFIVGTYAIFELNRMYLPEMYDDRAMAEVATAFADGKNYAAFDLNINIRELRSEQIRRFKTAPEVVILGASHWQEAHVNLLPGVDFFNSHIHRDYWQDMLAMVNVFDRQDKLPKKLIISLRDKLFTPISARKDFLWEPGIPAWRDMADRLSLPKESFVASYPVQRVKERLSLAMLFNNVVKWHNAVEKPGPTSDSHFKSFDTLLPGGSIYWSADHMQVFSQERAKREALSFAASARNTPPIIEQQGVAAFEKLLDFLSDKGVEVTFVQPPFNPVFWDAVQASPYLDGLKKMEAMTREIASRRGIKIVGGFNPYKVGCTSEQFIDAEHANPTCLKHIFDQYGSDVLAKGKSS